jgi:hypothetical protein
MTLATVLWILAVLATLVVVYRIASIWLRYSGNRLITCPENLRPAGVRVDAWRAAATALGQSPKLRLNTCSRWPEKSGCGQECLRQVEASPEECLVRTILTKWYAEKECVWCGKPIGRLHWEDRKPALALATNITLEWHQISAERLPEVLEVARPVCFACHTATSFARLHPELVTNRARSA